MCASLMSPAHATTEDLRVAIEQKLRKFGSLELMPTATKHLVKVAMHEVQKRDAAKEKRVAAR